MGDLNTVGKLNLLWKLERQILQRELAKEEAIEKLYTPEMLKAIEDIKAEYAIPEGIAQRKERLTKEVIEEVIEAKHTIKGDHKEAIFNKGRVTWNNDGLDGYVVDHPDLKKFRKEGKSYVTIKDL